MKNKLGVLIGGGLLAGVLMTPAYASFIEDWSTLSNGTGTKLSAVDANLAGWTFNSAKLGDYAASSGALKGVGGGGSITDKTAGKLHGESVGSATSIDLSFDLRTLNPVNDTKDGQAEVWISDANQNGYGLQINRTYTENTLRLIQRKGGTTSYGSSRTGGYVTGGWPAAVAYGTVLDDYQTLHLRIDQASGKGTTMTLTAWTDAESFASPLSTWDLTYTKVFTEISDLTYAGLSLDRSNSSGGAIFLDNLIIAIPEPATLGLIAMSGIAVIFLRRLVL